MRFRKIGLGLSQIGGQRLQLVYRRQQRPCPLDNLAVVQCVLNLLHRQPQIAQLANGVEAAQRLQELLVAPHVRQQIRRGKGYCRGIRAAHLPAIHAQLEAVGEQRGVPDLQALLQLPFQPGDRLQLGAHSGLQMVTDGCCARVLVADHAGRQPQPLEDGGPEVERQRLGRL